MMYLQGYGTYYDLMDQRFFLWFCFFFFWKRMVAMGQLITSWDLFFTPFMNTLSYWSYQRGWAFCLMGLKSVDTV